MLRLSIQIPPLWALPILGLCLAAPARAEIVDGVAAIVNGDIIMLSEVEEHAGPGLPPVTAIGEARLHRESMLKRAAEDLVIERLVAHECKDQSLEPTAAEIDSAIEDVQRSNHIDKPTLEQALRQQGLTMPKYREMLTEQLCRMKVVEMKVKNRVSMPSELDVNTELANESGGAPAVGIQEMKLRDIFIPMGTDASGARNRIGIAYSKLRNGDDFAAVAHATEGPMAATGGDLGWVKASDLAADLRKVAQSLKEGAMSEIVDTSAGFHILKLESVRTSTDVESQRKKKEEVRNRLMQAKMEKATDDYIQELRRAAEIEYRIP
jgi:peptidyl-prolyl cis-trans isomerase SurA